MIIYFLLTSMVIIWSFSFIMVDIVVDFIPPITIALNRFIIASLAFLILDLYKIIRKNKIKHTNVESNTVQKFSKKQWIYLISASITGISLFFFSQYTAIELIGPSLPALFVCLLAPVIITLLALIFFNEKISLIKIFGFIIATFGGFLLITGGNITILSPENPSFLGYLFALGTPVLWALYSILTKRVLQQQSNLKVLKIIAYLGTIELLFFSMINNEFYYYTLYFSNWLVILSGIYLGIGCYIIGYFIWQKAQKELQSSRGASFLYIEPFLTLLFSFLLNRNETIVVGNIIGGIIILIAVFILNYK